MPTSAGLSAGVSSEGGCCIGSIQIINQYIIMDDQLTLHHHNQHRKYYFLQGKTIICIWQNHCHYGRDSYIFDDINWQFIYSYIFIEIGMEGINQENSYLKGSSVTDSETKISKQMALSKLKELKEKIQATKNKILVQQSKQQRGKIKHQQQKRKLETRSMVERDIEELKQKKIQLESSAENKINEVKKKNYKRKKEQKKKLNLVMLSCRQTKNKIYDAVKKQQSQNNRMIQLNRQRSYEQKRQKHWLVMESQFKRRRYLQQYMQNKNAVQREYRQWETNKVLENIQEQQKILEKLERDSSVDSKERDKNFRLRIVSKGTTTYIP